jgi:hypothetical protein
MEPAIPTSEWSQVYTLDRAASEIGVEITCDVYNFADVLL